MEDFYNDWDSNKLNELTGELKEYIYADYVGKCEALQRDNFTCQNDNCPYCHNEQYYNRLTLHHIKAKRNHKKNHYTKLLGERGRNKVTLCYNVHKAYERGKCNLVFTNDTLPPHIKGHTFKIQKEEIDWKKIVSEGKKIRKANKQYWGQQISWDLVCILMKFLFEFEYKDEEEL